MRHSTTRGYATPLAIIVAGLLIAGAFFATNASPKNEVGDTHVSFRTPSADEHVRGNPDAAITIVEFSDFECPFCARLHPTLKKIVEDETDVKWVYRHFPLNSHTNAFAAAVASECVARAGGNGAFWDFADAAFANQRQLGTAFYERFARDAGLEVDAFASCVNDRQVAREVRQDLDEVLAAGGRGTPYVVVVSPTGTMYPFSGALSYEQVAGVIEQARAN